MEYDRNRDVLPYQKWGEPHARVCLCGATMKIDRRSSQFICEPPQVWVLWRCGCGTTEAVAYEDSYDPQDSDRTIPPAEKCLKFPSLEAPLTLHQIPLVTHTAVPTHPT